ncbi:hypothetical protein FQZ97_1135780 [compost metagenome]
MPRIEANARLVRDQWVVVEAFVLFRVADLQDLILQNRMPTEGNLPRSFAGVQAGAGLEPLPVGVHQRHQRDGHVKQASGKTGQAVKPLFGCGIKQLERVQILEASGFVVRFAWHKHRKLHWQHFMKSSPGPMPFKPNG